MIDAQDLSRTRAIDPRHVAVFFVKAHQPMDRFNFTERRFDARGGIGAFGADLNQGTQERPGTAYFT
jgi:hypothetical protein